MNVIKFRSFPHFIDWANALDRNAWFEFRSNRDCVFAMWSRACGATDPNVGAFEMLPILGGSIWIAFTEWQQSLSKMFARNLTVTKAQILQYIAEYQEDEQLT